MNRQQKKKKNSEDIDNRFTIIIIIIIVVETSFGKIVQFDFRSNSCIDLQTRVSFFFEFFVLNVVKFVRGVRTGY